MLTLMTLWLSGQAKPVRSDRQGGLVPDSVFNLQMTDDRWKMNIRETGPAPDTLQLHAKA